MTRGMGYFWTEDPKTGEKEEMAAVYINSDAYPSGFGNDICKKLANMEKPYRNAERVILKLIEGQEADVYFGDEYIYTFTFKRFNEENVSVDINDYLQIEVKSKYGEKEDDFVGDLQDFQKFCE